MREGTSLASRALFLTGHSIGETVGRSRNHDEIAITTLPADAVDTTREWPRGLRKRPFERSSPPHTALVFGPVGIHHTLDRLVDLVEDEGTRR